MARQVLILQSDAQITAQLSHFFTEWHDHVWQANTPAEAKTLLKQYKPGLVIIDLQLSTHGAENIVSQLQKKQPNTKLLFTSTYPAPQKELFIKQTYGAQVFLQAPFTRSGLEQALHELENNAANKLETSTRPTTPRVRMPVRIKLTLPYVILALVLALGAAYVVSQIVLDTIEERFTNQLIEAGKLTSDWMVNEENRLLETLRLLSYTQGVAEAVRTDNAEQLRQIALPLAVNSQEEALEILNLQGTSLLSLRHKANAPPEDYEATQGETIFNQWSFVNNVLQQPAIQERDKYAGFARASWGDFLYVAGPITDEQGQQVGVILVGKSLPTLVDQIRQHTFAHITIYDLGGQAMASTFFLLKGHTPLAEETIAEILKRQDEASLMRALQVASIDYREILGPWETDGVLASTATLNNYNDIGLIGVSLAETFLAQPGQITRLQIFLLTAATFILVIVLGVYLANRITRPLLYMVTASAQVAHGDLNVQVESSGNDEIAVLAHSFNEMVVGLREGSVYRDLLGRTVSPEVREQLRQGFASGDVHLKGQETTATVLTTNIHNFTTISELESPTTIMEWLNEYFEAITPIINDYDGIISKFEGEAILAFFGVLPRSAPAQESAYQACRATLTILDTVDTLNQRRVKRGDPMFRMGVGINTGPVTAGALGSADRLHYTIIGDTVNAATRLERFTRQFGRESSAVISQHTLFALRDQRHEFKLDAMGAHTVKGKMEQLLVYRLEQQELVSSK